MKPIPSGRPVRWGILGAGGIAATVLPEILAVAGNAVVAVAARDAVRAKEFAARFGIARSYSSYEELAGDPEVDVIYIATVHSRHHDQAIMCLEAGKSVLVEKAFTLTAAQAREVAAAAHRADRFCMEAMWLRFNPLLGIAEQVVRNGGIGDVQSVRAELCRLFPFDPASRFYDPAQGGGALLDLGVYPINFVWAIMGHPHAVGTTGVVGQSGVDETVAMQFDYGDGRYAQLACSLRARSEPVSVIVGTEGWIEAHGAVHRPTRLVIRHGDQTVEHPAPEVGAGYQPQFAEAARCLREGHTESEFMPLSESIAIMEVIDGVRRDLGIQH